MLGVLWVHRQPSRQQVAASSGTLAARHHISSTAKQQENAQSYLHQQHQVPSGRSSGAVCSGAVQRCCVIAPPLQSLTLGLQLNHLYIIRAAHYKIARPLPFNMAFQSQVRWTRKRGRGDREEVRCINKFLIRWGKKEASPQFCIIFIFDKPRHLLIQNVLGRLLHL